METTVLENNSSSLELFFVDQEGFDINSLSLNEMMGTDGGLENLPGWAYFVSPIGALVTDYIIDKYNKGCACK